MKDFFSRKVVSIVCCTLLVIGIASGCQRNSQTPQKIVLADQYGLAYAPVEIMKQLKLVEEFAGTGVEVVWSKMANTQTIRESMLAGQLDVGFMAIPPFLIGVDSGMDWRLMSGISESPLGLIANAKRVSSFEALRTMVNENDKIALPQPGSIQHILLSMASKRQWGDAQLFDQSLVAMKHPDGLSALLADQQVVAHFTAPPYLQLGLAEPDMTTLLTGEEAFGGSFTFIVGVSHADFYSRENHYRAVEEALKAALDYIESQPEDTAKRLAQAYNISEAEAYEQLYKQGMRFSDHIEGLEAFAEFMVAEGLIESVLPWSDYYFEGQ